MFLDLAASQGPLLTFLLALRLWSWTRTDPKLGIGEHLKVFFTYTIKPIAALVFAFLATVYINSASLNIPSRKREFILALVAVCGCLWIWLAMRKDSTKTLKDQSQGLETVAKGVFLLTAVSLACLISDRSPDISSQSLDKAYPGWQISLATFGCMQLFGIMSIVPSQKTGFLNRDQTNEWKGWLACYVVIYHVFNMSKDTLDVYASRGTYLAMFLVMSGYGNFLYWYNKANYSLIRVALVLVRLNILTFLLCYILDRAYLDYYFVGVISIWYLLLYVFMSVGSVYNSIGWFMTLKFGLATTIITIVFWKWQPSSPLATNELEFRLGLDRYATLVGAAIAYISIRLGINNGGSTGSSDSKSQLSTLEEGEDIENGLLKQNRKIDSKHTFALTSFSIIIYLFALWWWSTCATKIECNRFNPVLSVFVILVFIWARNAAISTRHLHSSFFEEAGKISLELYLLQFHVLQCNNGSQLLVLVPGNDLINMVAVISWFIFLAHTANNGTDALITGIMQAGYRSWAGAMAHRTKYYPKISNVCLPPGDDKTLTAGLYSDVAECESSRLEPVTPEFPRFTGFAPDGLAGSEFVGSPIPPPPITA
eukprot:UC4_evm2s426